MKNDFNTKITINSIDYDVQFFSVGGSATVYKITNCIDKSISLLKEINCEGLNFNEDLKADFIKKIFTHERVMAEELQSKYYPDQGIMPADGIFVGREVTIDTNETSTAIRYFLYETKGGQTLAEYIEKLSEKKDICKFLRLIIKCLKILDSVFHSRNFYHLDLKADNIYISEQGSIYFLDLANSHNAKGNIENLIETHLFSTSGLYSAPELIEIQKFQQEYFRYTNLCNEKNDLICKIANDQMKKIVVHFSKLTQSLSISSDLYSIAQILQATFFSSYGEFLFPNISNIKEQLFSIISKATENDPQKRYQTSNEFISDLTKCLNVLENFDKEIILENSKRFCEATWKNLPFNEDLLTEIKILDGKEI